MARIPRLDFAGWGTCLACHRGGCRGGRLRDGGRFLPFAGLTTGASPRYRAAERFEMHRDIEALDPNLFTYVAGNRSARAGIDRGYGVFAAMTAARIEF